MTAAETGADLRRSGTRPFDYASTARISTTPATDRGAAKLTASAMSVPSAALPTELVDVARIPAPRARPTQVRAPASLGESARTRWLARHAFILAICDGVLAVVAVFTALALATPAPERAVWMACLLALPLLWVATLSVGRTYDQRNLEDGSGDHRRIVGLGIRWIGVSGFLALGTSWPLARTLTLVAFPLMVLSALAVHCAGHAIESRARRRGITVHRALVVGSERATAEMIRRLSHRDDHGFQIVGALVDRSQQSLIEGVPVVGRAHDFHAALEEHDADTLVVAAWSTLSQQELRRLSWELEDSKVDVLVTPNLTDVAGTRISVRPVVGLPLLQVERPEFTGLRRVVKGAFDRLSAGVALLLLSPILLGLIVAVRLDSRGPAFYRQERVGRRGSSFPMLKFRTMEDGAHDLVADLRDRNDHDGGPMFKMKDDPRITRVGSFLRRYSLDELPQLWNVLKGQMSLVGPRPPLPEEVAQYPDDVHRRLLVKPGMTGLWQVSGRSDLDWEESVRLDLYYVDNWSFMLDLSLITKTFRAVVAGEGAY